MRSLPLASAVAVATALAAGGASADDRAIAEQAFQQGRELMAAGDVAAACPKFAAAAKLSQTAGVRLNLADCYARLGKTASAWAKADEALAIAERAVDVAATDLARSRLADLKPQLSYLTIAVAKAVVRGTEIVLDGDAIPDGLWGTALPVDPGEHEVVVKAPARRPWSMRTIVRGPGSRTTVSVPAQVGEPSTGSPAGAIQILAIGSGVFGLAGLGVGTGFGLDASSKKSQYQRHQVNGRCVDEQCVTISQQAVSSATISTVGFAAGGALAATAVFLWLAIPARDAEGRAAGLAPMLGPQTAGLRLSGSW